MGDAGAAATPPGSVGAPSLAMVAAASGGMAMVPATPSILGGSAASVAASSLSLPSGMLPLPSAFGGSMAGAAAANIMLGKFLCPCCKKEWPAVDGVQKGSQIWCRKDVSSYQSLQSRWQKNQKLKRWWQNMSTDEKRSWYLKWQLLSPQARFSSITYQETVIESMEDIEDDVENYSTYAMWRRDNMTVGEEETSLRARFMEIVDQNRSECLYRRGQWLIPEYMGVQRRIRRRVAEESRVTRTADIDNANHLAELQASGRARLEQFRASISEAVTPGLTPENTAPEITSRPSDQPTHGATTSVLGLAIGREVS